MPVIILGLSGKDTSLSLTRSYNSQYSYGKEKIVYVGGNVKCLEWLTDLLGSYVVLSVCISRHERSQLCMSGRQVSSMMGWGFMSLRLALSLRILHESMLSAIMSSAAAR